MRTRRLVSTALIVVLGAALAACGSATQDAAPVQDSDTPASAVAGSSLGSYPVTITNCGTDYTFTSIPERTVIMNGGSVAEVSTLLALGLRDRISVNAQNYGASEVPGRAEAIAALPTGGITLNDAMDIPREPMLGLRPDFVISTWGGGFSSQNGFATREELLKAGANTYVPPKSCDPEGALSGDQTIEDSYVLLRDLGRIYGVEAKANELIAESRRQVSEVSAKVAGKGTPRVMLIIPGMAMGAGEFSSIGANGIWNEIIASAGGVNAFDDSSNELFANLSKEQVAAENVDAVIIVNYLNPDPEGSAKQLFAQFPQWEAARNNRFVVLSDSIYLGPDNAVAVDRIARAIHPDEFS